MELKLHYDGGGVSYLRPIKWIENTINHHSLFIWKLFDAHVLSFSFSLVLLVILKMVFVVYKLFPVTRSWLVVHGGSTRWKGKQRQMFKNSKHQCVCCLLLWQIVWVQRLPLWRLWRLCGCRVTSSLGQDDSSSRWLTSVWKCGTNDTFLIWSGKSWILKFFFF